MNQSLTLDNRDIQSNLSNNYPSQEPLGSDNTVQLQEGNSSGNLSTGQKGREDEKTMTGGSNADSETVDQSKVEVRPNQSANDSGSSGLVEEKTRTNYVQRAQQPLTATLEPPSPIDNRYRSRSGGVPQGSWRNTNRSWRLKPEENTAVPVLPQISTKNRSRSGGLPPGTKYQPRNANLQVPGDGNNPSLASVQMKKGNVNTQSPTPNRKNNRSLSRGRGKARVTTNPAKADLDNHANQMNPNNEAYWHSRGLEKPGSMNYQAKANLDNHANQMNPNNEAYWRSRGLKKIPPSVTNVSGTDPAPQQNTNSPQISSNLPTEQSQEMNNSVPTVVEISVDDQSPSSYTKAELDNHANQLNPNNDVFYASRGVEKPAVDQTQVEQAKPETQAVEDKQETTVDQTKSNLDNKRANQLNPNNQETGNLEDKNGGDMKYQPMARSQRIN